MTPPAPAAPPAHARPGGLRLLQVFNRYLKPGGEETSVGRIARDLELGGHTVTRFWRASDEWQRPGGPSRWRQALWMWRNPAVLAELRQAHEDARADAWILHNVLPVVSLGIYRLARELNVPILQWLHNYRPISPGGALFAGGRHLDPDDPWLAWKEAWHGTWHGRVATAWLVLGYHRARRRGDFESVRAWVAVSEEMKRIFARAGWFPERLHALPHSWHAQPAPAETRDEGYFLFLGRMIEPKGVRFLIDLWRDPALRSLELVMAGDGPLAAELRSQSPPNVRWVGYVEGAAKQQLKAGCRAVLFPSLWPEPLSTVAYEAYEMNKPILASNQGGMPEVVRHEETGLLLPAGAADAWRTQVLRLAADPGLAARLGAAGRRWLDTEVSPARWVERFNDIARQSGCLR